MFKGFTIKLGCFLTGYNFALVNTCSESAKGKVKQYLAGLFIISILWFLVGFSFTKRYLDLGFFQSMLAGFVFTFIVIQIERQIILASGKSKVVLTFRVLLALIMAIIGSLILDQIIYADDLEKRKSQVIGQESQQITASQAIELDRFKISLEKELVGKQAQESAIIRELNEKPFIQSTNYSQTVKTGGIDNKKLELANAEKKQIPEITNKVDIVQVPNPIYKDKERLTSQIENINKKIIEIEDKKINLGETIRKQLEENRGFLDELSLMIGILKDSWVALIVYILVFFFLLSLELLVVFTKLYGQKTDLEKLLEYQVQTRSLTIDKLTQELNNSSKN